jgi:myo-inositol-1(or 4)-monophosphatase
MTNTHKTPVSVEALNTAFLFKTQGVRRIGSASLDMCYVASGRLDGFWEFKLNPGILQLQHLLSGNPVGL